MGRTMLDESVPPLWPGAHVVEFSDSVKQLLSVRQRRSHTVWMAEACSPWRLFCCCFCLCLLMIATCGLFAMGVCPIGIVRLPMFGAHVVGVCDSVEQFL